MDGIYLKAKEDEIGEAGFDEKTSVTEMIRLVEEGE